MRDLTKFMKDCAFYPCSRLDMRPMRMLPGHNVRRFFYTDYIVQRHELLEALRSDAVGGYRLVREVEVGPKSVFGVSWRDMRERFADRFDRLHLDWTDPYLVMCQLQRSEIVTPEASPVSIELLFARCEGVTALELAFYRRAIAPRCLVHICPGIGFGGNYPGYMPDLAAALSGIRELARPLRGTGGGLPELLLHFDAARRPTCGDYLDVVQFYEEINRWSDDVDGCIYLGRLRDVAYNPGAGRERCSWGTPT